MRRPILAEGPVAALGRKRREALPDDTEDTVQDATPTTLSKWDVLSETGPLPRAVTGADEDEEETSRLVLPWLETLDAPSDEP